MPTPVPLEGTDWGRLLVSEFGRPYWRNLHSFLEDERSRYEVYPPEELVYLAFQLTACEETKVVIVGQDPYHGPGQADGLCFSVSAGVRKPLSLRNILQELRADRGVAIPDHGSLEAWARRGVLLLNATLTVRRGQAGSHVGRGWETFTDEVIRQVAARSRPVFLLWGRMAQRKKVLASEYGCTVIESAHPSRAARWGFFGSRPFSLADRALKASGREAINWDLCGHA
jgi:uracil-DNA glycosylase